MTWDGEIGGGEPPLFGGVRRRRETRANTSLRQRPAKLVSEMFGDVHRTLITALVAQLCESKFILRLLGRWDQVRAHKLADGSVVGQLVETCCELVNKIFAALKQTSKRCG